MVGSGLPHPLRSVVAGKTAAGCASTVMASGTLDLDGDFQDLRRGFRCLQFWSFPTPWCGSVPCRGPSATTESSTPRPRASATMVCRGCSLSPCLRLLALPPALTRERLTSYALRASRSGLDCPRTDCDRDARQVRSANQALDDRKPEAGEEDRPPARSALVALTGGDRRPRSTGASRCYASTPEPIQSRLLSSIVSTRTEFTIGTGHDEKVHGNELPKMVVQERAPSLRGRLATTDHVLAHARLPNVDAELE